MSSKAKKITLVLGAGASHAMGYPVGDGLRSKILNLAVTDRQSFAIRAGLYAEEGLLQRFVGAFRTSQMCSIDAFLARRPEFSSIGKLSIAAILLEIEDEVRLFNTEHRDHWYRYFYNKFATESWDKLDFSNISIVTFNYDRSLERFLFGSIKESYGKTDAETSLKLDTLNIVHVYGSIGSPIHGKPDHIVYGGEVTREKAQTSANFLRVIPEGREDDEALSIARAMLENADRIAFMGFGFDEINVQRLQPERTCKCKNRRIVATCLGFTTAESTKAFLLIGQELERYPQVHPPGFHHDNCLNMLRETLILDQPMILRQ